MILGQISYLDCFVFLVSLAPQLLIHVNLIDLIVCVLCALPFFCVVLPVSFIEERFIRPKRKRSPFVQQSTGFQDFVVRCVRYAFAKMPAKIGRVFFSRNVSLPFIRFRMLRHGIYRYPIDWYEVDIDKVKGILIRDDMSTTPDIVIYYCHGGGFAMGSPHFYLEPMLALATLLKQHYRNPAIFSLDYSLVPDATHPTQLTEVLAGYSFTLSLAGGDASRICVGGDSAGGTLVLSLLLRLAKDPAAQQPGYATLLSPWIKLVSKNNLDTHSDFLNADSLDVYARQYAGVRENLTNPLASPGCCTDLDWWRQAAPTNGFYVTFGSEEVLGPEIRAFVKLLRSAGVGIRVREEPGQVHAWVIASLFLEDSLEDRISGMKGVVRAVRSAIEPGK